MTELAVQNEPSAQPLAQRLQKPMADIGLGVRYPSLQGANFCVAFADGNCSVADRQSRTVAKRHAVYSC